MRRKPIFFLASLWVVATAAFARLFLEPSRYSRPVAIVLGGLTALGIVSTAIALFAAYRPAAVLASGVADTLEVEGSGIVTVSVGVGTSLPEDDDGGAELVVLADAARYEAKRKGREPVVEVSIE